MNPYTEYAGMVEAQRLDPAELDYSILERHKAILASLAQVSGCGITVYDMHRGCHVFTSCNFGHLFGDNSGDVSDRIPPEDLEVLLRNGVATFKYMLGEGRKHFGHSKLVNEYRLTTAGGGFLRVIEQFQVLEFDPAGNVWLSLSVLDVSPNQEPMDGVHSKLMNCSTGQVFNLPEFSGSPAVALSGREKEILSMVRDGKLSKEISGRLAISVHTVNTHRQRILEKLNVDNSMEAVRYASKYGLLD